MTGRLTRKANNTLLLLALLAEPELDTERAERLLAHVETARSPNVALSLHLADRLGVEAPFRQTRENVANSHKVSGLRAIEVLRGELDPATTAS